MEMGAAVTGCSMCQTSMGSTTAAITISGNTEFDNKLRNILYIINLIEICYVRPHWHRLCKPGRLGPSWTHDGQSPLVCLPLFSAPTTMSHLHSILNPESSRRQQQQYVLLKYTYPLKPLVFQQIICHYSPRGPKIFICRPKVLICRRRRGFPHL